MRIVVGVDWSEEAFSAVQQAVLLYRPTEVTVVHGVEIEIAATNSQKNLAEQESCDAT